MKAAYNENERIKQVKNMSRTIIIEGNSVYELDENCMLKKHRKAEEEKKENTRADNSSEGKNTK